jgi:hypothetical protein
MAGRPGTFAGDDAAASGGRGGGAGRAGRLTFGAAAWDGRLVDDSGIRLG